MKSDFNSILRTIPKDKHKVKYRHCRTFYKRMSFDEAPLRVANRGSYRFSRLKWKAMKNFLKSRVGQSWDDVYSEIKSNLDPQAITSLDFMVLKHGIRIDDDGQVWVIEPHKYYSLRGLFYVCPKEHTLQRFKQAAQY